MMRPVEVDAAGAGEVEEALTCFFGAIATAAVATAGCGGGGRSWSYRWWTLDEGELKLQLHEAAARREAEATMGVDRASPFASAQRGLSLRLKPQFTSSSRIHHYCVYEAGGSRKSLPSPSGTLVCKLSRRLCLSRVTGH